MKKHHGLSSIDDSLAGRFSHHRAAIGTFIMTRREVPMSHYTAGPPDPRSYVTIAHGDDEDALTYQIDDIRNVEV